MFARTAKLNLGYNPEIYEKTNLYIVASWSTFLFLFLTGWSKIHLLRFSHGSFIIYCIYLDKDTSFLNCACSLLMIRVCICDHQLLHVFFCMHVYRMPLLWLGMSVKNFVGERRATILMLHILCRHSWVLVVDMVMFGAYFSSL